MAKGRWQVGTGRTAVIDWGEIVKAECTILIDLKAFRPLKQLMTITTSLSSYVERESKNILLNVTTLFSERVNHCDNHCNLPASKIF